MINLVLRNLSSVAADGSVMMRELESSDLLGCGLSVKWLLSSGLSEPILLASRS